MIKTVFTVRYNRDGPFIGSCMSVEWPDNLLATTIKTLSQIRKERVEETAIAVLPEEVLEFCKNYWMVEMRAQLNNEDGPYVVNSEEAVEDKVLL